MDDTVINLADKINELATSNDESSGFFKVGSDTYYEHLHSLSEKEKKLFLAIKYIQEIKTAL